MGAQLRSHCSKRLAKTGSKKGYETVNGNAKDYKSTDESTESVEINHSNFSLLKNNKEYYKDYQTIKQY